MGHREDTDTLNRMTIQAVGGLLGLKLPLRGTVRCPFADHDDRSPSFEVRPSGNRWVCYGCDRRGGAIDLVRTHRGVSFLEAKQWLKNRTGVCTAPDPQHGRKRVPRAVMQSQSITMEESESPPDHEVYEAFRERTPLQSDGRNYLSARGLSEITVSNFRIGQLSDGKKTIEQLIQEFGFRRIEAAGLLTKNSSSHNWRALFPDDSLVFPFLEAGRIAYLQVRLIANIEDQGKWRNLNHRKRRIYNADALANTVRRPFAVCEGVMDTLSAIELGYDGIGIMGVSATLTEQQIKKLRGKHVDILMDWDAPGEKKAVALQREMRRFGVVSNRKNRPSPMAKDVNEHLVVLRGRG